MSDLFKAPDLDTTANQLADHLPSGEVWTAKNIDGTNMRALIKASSVPFNYVQSKVEELALEFDINTATLLLPEWEASVGLPDCINTSSQSIDQRREAVKRRLRKETIVTIEEMQDYVDAILDNVTLALYPGHDYYSLPYALPQPLLGNVDSRFILVAELPISSSSLPYSLPQQLVRGADNSVLRCLLEKVIPANVYLDIKEV